MPVSFYYGQSQNEEKRTERLVKQVDLRIFLSFFVFVHQVITQIKPKNINSGWQLSFIRPITKEWTSKEKKENRAHEFHELAMVQHRLTEPSCYI
jgi:hypothetical protein